MADQLNENEMKQLNEIIVPFLKQHLSQTINMAFESLHNDFHRDFNRLFEKYMAENTGIKGFISSELERVKSVTQSMIEDFVNSDQRMNQITDMQLNTLAEKNKETINKLHQNIRLYDQKLDNTLLKITTLETKIEEVKKTNNGYYILGITGIAILGLFGLHIIRTNNKIISTVVTELARLKNRY